MGGAVNDESAKNKYSTLFAFEPNPESFSGARATVESNAPETANGDVVAQPVPTSAVRRGLENANLGFDENTEEGKRARAEAIARACGFDGKAVAKERCLREAFATIWV